jgi:hypothetical protein
MLKLQISWELETGEKFDEWTRPIELAMAEKELYNNSLVTKSNNVSQRRLKVLTLGKTKSSLLQLLILRQQILPSPKYWANSNRISNSNWDNTRLLAQCRTRNMGYSNQRIERAQ